MTSALPFARSEKQAERLLKRLLTKWSKLLGLWHDWEISIDIAKDEDMNNDGWAAGFTTAAECSTHWEYQQAKIRFSGPWLRRVSEKEIEETVVHEYQHVLLNELRRQAKMTSEERTATMLTRAFLRVAKAGAA